MSELQTKLIGSSISIDYEQNPVSGPSATMVTAKVLPTVVLPQPGRPTTTTTTTAISLVLAPQLKTQLLCIKTEDHSDYPKKTLGAASCPQLIDGTCALAQELYE